VGRQLACTQQLANGFAQGEAGETLQTRLAPQLDEFQSVLDKLNQSSQWIQDAQHGMRAVQREMAGLLDDNNGHAKQSSARPA
jgi:hypothetical protein